MFKLFKCVLVYMCMFACVGLDISAFQMFLERMGVTSLVRFGVFECAPECV